jgi:hypothetical protein
MLFPFSRIIALLMAGVLCFALLVPMSLAQHKPGLALFVGLIFIAYVIGNVVLWLRTRER